MLRFSVVVGLIVVLALHVFSQTAPNSDAAYQALRNPKPGNESLSLNQVVLKRDAGTFTLSGTLCFAAPVEGKVTGAVFSGNGSFNMEPPLAVERISLSRLTKQPRIDEQFERLVLRFTDETFAELKRAPGATSTQAACSPDAFADVGDALRKELKWNLAARLLQDVYGTRPGGLFAAFIKGKKYEGKALFMIDPHGTPDASPEEVQFMTYNDNRWGIWAAFHFATEYSKGTASSSERNSVIRVDDQQIDLTIEKNARLQGKATTKFVALQEGVRVVPFNLYPTLRVESVTDAAGTPLGFIQEDKDHDADFWVILPKPLAAGQELAIVTTYGGKDALTNQGSGNFYLAGGARDSWYPNALEWGYSSYDMRFTVPKDLKLVASGTPINEVQEGNQIISRWRSQEPQTVAAFHLGKCKKEEKVVKNITIETYANNDLPDVYRGIQAEADGEIELNGPRGSGPASWLNSISTTTMAKKAMAEADVSTQIYSDYFGELPFKRLAITQQTADNYGQSWPQLVWLPLSYFLDDTMRHAMYGFDIRGYFKMVGPHEIAHQWWGHTVLWASYRDQWMSEGFSDLAASLVLQFTRKNSEYIRFWEDERDMLVERNKEGFRAIDVGPLTLGYRLDNSKVGENVTRRLIYPKGAYVLHMIRMMMWTPKAGDRDFKATMRDFVATYRNRAATTEDFKAVVEKHLPPYLNLTGDGRLDWFFDQYVYGTALPSYKLEYSLQGMTLNMKIAQSGVDDRFQMVVPVYIEVANGQVFRLGTVPMKGNSSIDQSVDLAAAGLKEPPKRVLLNYFNDILCDKDK